MKNTTDLSISKTPFNADIDAHLVVSLNAPKLDWEAKRSQVRIIASLDVSPSMMGQKLDYAKKSLLKLIDQLRVGDWFGLVAFSSDSEVVVPLTQVVDATTRDDFRTRLGDIRVGGGTNFSAGMLTALKEATKSENVRVIMFTDGCANMGITSPSGLKTALNGNQGNATVSMFGYGDDANQELLADLATTGKGNYSYIKSPEDALNGFAKELGGLLSTYAQDITITVKAHGDHKITSVVSDVDSKGDEKSITVSLKDILSEEERHFVFAVNLAKQDKSLPRAVKVFDVEVAYSILGENGKTEQKTETLKAKVEFTKDETVTNKDVSKIVAQAQLVRAQIEADEKAKRGDYRGAAFVMNDMVANLNAQGHGDLANIGAVYTSSVSDSRSYASSTGTRSSLKKGLTRGMGGEYDTDSAVLLRSVGVAMDNHTHTSMKGAFQGPPTAPTTGTVNIPPSTINIPSMSPQDAIERMKQIVGQQPPPAPLAQQVPFDPLDLTGFQPILVKPLPKPTNPPPARRDDKAKGDGLNRSKSKGW